MGVYKQYLYMLRTYLARVAHRKQIAIHHVFVRGYTLNRYGIDNNGIFVVM